MSGRDAFEDEMGFLGRIRDEDAELVLAGRAPAPPGSGLDEVASFVVALRAAVPARPDPAAEASLVPRLAEASRSASDAPTVETAPIPAVRERRSRPRLALAARVAVAAILATAAMAGLAFAGVRLPEPARDAFDRVGVELPNQAEGDESATGADEPEAKDSASKSGDVEVRSDGADSGSGKDEGAKHPRRRHRAGDHSTGSQGGGGAESGGGGPSGVPPGQDGTPPGQGGTPPGQGGTPPGLASPPPGQGGTPPGQGGAIPGSGSGGQSAEPHGGGPPGDVPPGQAKPK